MANTLSQRSPEEMDALIHRPPMNEYKRLVSLGLAIDITQKSKQSYWTKENEHHFVSLSLKALQNNATKQELVELESIASIKLAAHEYELALNENKQIQQKVNACKTKLNELIRKQNNETILQ